VPVLAGSAAYAVTETLEWESGLDKKLHEAKGFYAIVAIATLGGVVLNFTPVDPIKALLFSAVVNCVIAVPIMVVMMLLGAQPKIMGHFVIGKRLRAMGWLATAIMAAAVVAMLWTLA
jgi:Mn2+/Fe2+ NRAMP family transporter